MADTYLGRPPGRPRRFDVEAALAIGQDLFHAHGYDAVGLAALTERIGIKPPSFYAAFGSKAGFFGRVLGRYAAAVLPLDAILAPGRPLAEAMADLLEQAARCYSACPDRRGCLVLESLRSCLDADSLALARQVAEGRRTQMREFVAATRPDAADTVVDAVTTAMSGLSASAREGWDGARLVTTARILGEGIRAQLAAVA